MDASVASIHVRFCLLYPAKLICPAIIMRTGYAFVDPFYNIASPALRVTGVAGVSPSCLGVRAGYNQDKSPVYSRVT